MLTDEQLKCSRIKHLERAVQLQWRSTLLAVHGVDSVHSRGGCGGGESWSFGTVFCFPWLRALHDTTAFSSRALISLDTDYDTFHGFFPVV